MYKESDMKSNMELADIIIVNYGLHYQVCVTRRLCFVEHSLASPLA
jgi:hypothetical protein